MHFIRHAEGTHNEAARKFGEGAYKDWAWEVSRSVVGCVRGGRGGGGGYVCTLSVDDYHRSMLDDPAVPSPKTNQTQHNPKTQDAELTAAGRAQCLRLHRRLVRSRLMEAVDLVYVRFGKEGKIWVVVYYIHIICTHSHGRKIGSTHIGWWCPYMYVYIQPKYNNTHIIQQSVASPLRRTLRTASLAFGEGENDAEEDWGGDGGNGGQREQLQRRRYLRPHVPPIVAVEAIRETAGGLLFWGGWVGGWVNMESVDGWVGGLAG